MCVWGGPGFSCWCIVWLHVRPHRGGVELDVGLMLSWGMASLSFP